MLDASGTAARDVRADRDPLGLSVAGGHEIRQRQRIWSQRQGHAGYHIWDMRDARGRRGAAACVVIPWFADRYAGGADWCSLAWWIHDHLPYAHMQFYPKLAAFNLLWREEGCDGIESFIAPRGFLTRPGMQNFAGDHAEAYKGYPPLVRIE